MLVDAGASIKVILTHLARDHELCLTTSEIKNIQRLRNPDPGQTRRAPFQIILGNKSLKVFGTIMEDLSHNVVASLNWLQHSKQHISWDTLFLTVQQ